MTERNLIVPLIRGAARSRPESFRVIAVLGFGSDRDKWGEDEVIPGHVISRRVFRHDSTYVLSLEGVLELNDTVRKRVTEGFSGHN